VARDGVVEGRLETVEGFLPDPAERHLSSFA